MGEVFSSSGEKTDSVVVPTPRLQGLFVPGIDNPEAVDGFGTVIPWGGGNTARRYVDYGISTGRDTQLNDLASSFIPAEGAGVTYNFEGLVGPQGIPGRDGIDGISHLIIAPNSNFLTALPHNINQINDLGTALDKLVYTTSYDTYFGELSWTEQQPAGASDKNWMRVASDSDGSNLIAGAAGKRLYTSDDSGATWTERQPAGASDKSWTAIASDNDGSILVAAVYAGRLYTSANSGVNWVERQPAGASDKNWIRAASDSDGSNLIACATGTGGRLYTSDDSGATWTERQPAGASDKDWYGVASDSDGSHLIAAIAAGRLYTSDDSGATWTERQPAGDDDKNWQSVASDSDGSNLIACVSSGRLYTSANSGVNWVERQPAGASDKNWTNVASDSDGSNLIACATGTGGRLYTSDDSGATWTERQPAGASDKDWYGVASDSDGSHLIAGIYEGRLYTGVYPVLYSEATWAESELTSAGRDILGDATAADQATTLGLGAANDVTHNTLTLSSIAAEGTDVDKFLVDSTGVIKYRTGTQVLSDIGASASNHNHTGVYEPADAELTSLAGLTYAAASFVKMTGANTFALRTIGETADDLEATIDHDNLANGGAHDYSYISGNDAATDVTAAQLEELSDGSETTLHSHAGGNAFETITGITNDVVADAVDDTLTLAASGPLTIVGTTATDTITFTVDAYSKAEIDAVVGHDGDGYVLRDVNGTPTKVYTKYFTGTLDADATTLVAHGVTAANILAVSIICYEDNGNQYTVDDFRLPDSISLAYGVFYDSTNIKILVVGEYLQGNSYRIKIDYII